MSELVTYAKQLVQKTNKKTLTDDEEDVMYDTIDELT